MIFYLILSHGGAGPVRRLAQRLIADDAQARVVIHHDASAAPFGATGDERIELVPGPLRVHWGDVSVVEAMLRGLAHIARTGAPYRWIVLLSGQDYPVRNVADLGRRLDASGCDGFIDHAPAHAAFAAENATRYFFDYRRLPELLRPLVRRAWRINGGQSMLQLVATRAGCFIGTPARAPFDANLQCYRGSFWWTLSRPCIAYLLDYIAAHPQIVGAFGRKLVPDEAFVHSILASAGTFALSSDDDRYITWPEGHAGSPAVLRASDYDALIGSGKTFARKFDPVADEAILDRLDARAARTARATGPYADW